MLLRGPKTHKMSPIKTPETISLAPVDRRTFIKTSTLAAGALVFGATRRLCAGQNLNSKLNIACVGISGKGRSDTDACAGEHIAALCDVDTGTDAYTIQTGKYPDAKFYKDFRQMFDQMANQIDAVTVSTPESHARHHRVRSHEAAQGSLLPKAAHGRRFMKRAICVRWPKIKSW